VGLATIAWVYVGCTVAVTSTPDRAQDWELRPDVVVVNPGDVPDTVVAPLLSADVVPARRGTNNEFVLPCAGLARVEDVSCPYAPESGNLEPVPGTAATGPVIAMYFITDGSLAAENRIRIQVANLVPNAIINSERDPTDQQWETFFRDFDRLGVVGAFFVMILGAFGLAAAMAGGLIERRRPLALLRASGMKLGELRRAAFLETAATMAVISLVGAGVGMLLAYGATRQAAVDWHWPGWEVFGLIGGGVLAALLFSTIALPLLALTTRYDAVRFE
jgi:hypothetical protein